jgi:MOSC domain-containing protein YiiM
MSAKILAVHLSPTHSFSKQTVNSVKLVAGVGVEGDAHSGTTVKHRSRVARDPSQPNLRQVHLVHAELLEELQSQGHPVVPGSIGENLTTSGIDLLALPQGAKLHIGAGAIVVITGLRNPCAQLDNFSAGLTGAVLDRTTDGQLVRKAGVMGVVASSGDVVPGDPITVVLPPGPQLPLKPV